MWAHNLSFLVEKAKTPVRGGAGVLRFRLELRVRFQVSEEVEGTGSYGLCQVYITQGEGLLRGRARGAMSNRGSTSVNLQNGNVTAQGGGGGAFEGCSHGRRGRDEMKRGHWTRKDLQDRTHASRGRRGEWRGR